MSKYQNAHLTFKGNLGVGRHGWLRLTPAYSIGLVREHVAALPPGSVVTDPFSGTGTTALAAVEHGLCGQALDVNPFLIWLGNVKTRRYQEMDLRSALDALPVITSSAREVCGLSDLWQPRLANIERWWSHSRLEALKAIRWVLDQRQSDAVRDLLDVAFCRTLIDVSNAAFNHQSMSFKNVAPDVARLFEVDEASAVIEQYSREASDILITAAAGLPGRAAILLGDSRDMQAPGLEPADLLFTSPPYANRMSYIRELRPYMYWLHFLDLASDAGELDWTAIGGTWGTATSRLLSWSSNEPLPIQNEIDSVCEGIALDGGKNGPLLSAYVHKYFVDMWEHFQAAYKHVKSGGRATYIIGNSTFYGHVVPAEQWYREMLLEAGFHSATVEAIRKRNSKKELFEFDVSAMRP
ncbi:MAG: DNA methyltransferase [Actinomycetes bacterium]